MLVGAALLSAVSAGAAVVDRGGPWVERLRRAVLALVASEVLLGGVLWLSGARPAEGLHLLYGALILGPLPLASSFAAEAPPRARSWVLAVAGGLLLLFAWRLFATA